MIFTMCDLKDESFFNEPLPEKKPSGYKWVWSGWMTKLNKFQLKMQQMEVEEIKEADETEDKVDNKVSEKPIRKQKNQLF